MIEITFKRRKVRRTGKIKKTELVHENASQTQFVQ